MRTTVIFGVLTAALLAAGPARADHKLLTPDEPQAAAPQAENGKPEGMQTESSLDIDVKLGLNGFRLGTRLFGREGYAGGAWLNGQTRPEGFSLDGRVERDGKAHNFKMNIDLDEWLRRAARWWTRGQTEL
jgi:hypothetical protein